MVSSRAFRYGRYYDSSLYAVPADLTARYRGHISNSRRQTDRRENATETQVSGDFAYTYSHEANVEALEERAEAITSHFGAIISQPPLSSLQDSLLNSSVPFLLDSGVTSPRVFAPRSSQGGNHPSINDPHGPDWASNTSRGVKRARESDDGNDGYEGDSETLKQWTPRDIKTEPEDSEPSPEPSSDTPSSPSLDSSSESDISYDGTMSFWYRKEKRQKRRHERKAYRRQERAQRTLAREYMSTKKSRVNPALETSVTQVKSSSSPLASRAPTPIPPQGNLLNDYPLLPIIGSSNYVPLPRPTRFVSPSNSQGIYAPSTPRAPEASTSFPPRGSQRGFSLPRFPLHLPQFYLSSQTPTRVVPQDSPRDVNESLASQISAPSLFLRATAESVYYPPPAAVPSPPRDPTAAAVYYNQAFYSSWASSATRASTHFPFQTSETGGSSFSTLASSSSQASSSASLERLQLRYILNHYEQDGH